MIDKECIETAERRLLDKIIALMGYAGVVWFIVERFHG